MGLFISEPDGHLSDQLVFGNNRVQLNPILPDSFIARVGQLIPVDGPASYVQLLSDGCNTGIEGDTSCFWLPVGDDSGGQSHARYIYEDLNGLAVYIEGEHRYTVHSDGDVPAIPEPETYAMLLAGLGLLGFAVRRRKLLPLSRFEQHSQKPGSAVFTALHN